MDSENMYLEAMNQLKDKFKDNEKIVKDIKDENLHLKKQLMAIYGIVRLIENSFDDEMGRSIANTNVLIEMLRGLLSDIIEDDLLKIKKEMVEIDLDD